MNFFSTVRSNSFKLIVKSECCNYTGHAWRRKVGDDLAPDWSDGPTIPELLQRLIKPIQEFQDNDQNDAWNDGKDEYSCDSDGSDL